MVRRQMLVLAVLEVGNHIKDNRFSRCTPRPFAAFTWEV
jgi:hypothetical protein